MSFQNCNEYMEEEAIKIDRSVYFGKRARSTLRKYVRNDRYMTKRNQSKVYDNMIIVMSKSKRSDDSHTHSHSKDKIYNFNTKVA
mmetsp:Transcript_29483/g.26062  ORF Transcript_29483/g.26062 Transcript_29483/m.26062 type:complete len:85 (-) Transcript_29483:635-889(-)